MAHSRERSRGFLERLGVDGGPAAAAAGPHSPTIKAAHAITEASSFLQQTDHRTAGEVDRFYNRLSAGKRLGAQASAASLPSFRGEPSAAELSNPASQVRLPHLGRGGTHSSVDPSQGFMTVPFVGKSHDNSYNMDTRGHGSSLSRYQKETLAPPWLSDVAEKSTTVWQELGGDGLFEGPGLSPEKAALSGVPAKLIRNSNATKPSSRVDVIRVKEWMMRELAAVVEESPLNPANEELEGGGAEGERLPSPSKSLLDLNIEDAIRWEGHATMRVLSEAYGELTRQVTVHCAERGILMAHIWHCAQRCMSCMEDRTQLFVKQLEEENRRLRARNDEVRELEKQNAELRGRITKFEQDKYGNVIEDLRDENKESARVIKLLREAYTGEQELVKRLQRSLQTHNYKLAEDEEEQTMMSSRILYLEEEVREQKLENQRVKARIEESSQELFDQKFKDYTERRSATTVQVVKAMEERFGGLSEDAVATFDADSYAKEAVKQIKNVSLKELVEMLAGGKTPRSLKVEIARKISDMTGLEVQAGRRRRFQGRRGSGIGDAATGDMVLNYTLASLFTKIQGMQNQISELNIELERRPKAFEERDQRPDEGAGGNEGKYFETLGSSLELPKFLRFNGKVRNRNLAKGATEQMVKDVWKEKEKEGGREIPLPEFFYEFLRKRFGIQSMIVEWGYNMMYALKKYSYDADCELFLKIMQGDVGEEVYHEQFQMINDIRAMCEHIDQLDNGGKRSKKIRREDFVKALKQYFSDKDTDDFDRLVSALHKDQPSGWVLYDRLFQEDREGDQGFFAEEVRDQFLAEREEFRKEIAKHLEEEATDVDGTKYVTPKVAIEAMLYVDASLSEESVDEYVKRGFGLSKDAELDPSLELPVTVFMKQFTSGTMQTSKAQNRASKFGKLKTVAAVTRKARSASVCPVPMPSMVAKHAAAMKGD